MSLLDNRRYKTFVGTLHCMLENGADLYVNKRQKIRHYRARGLLKKEEEEEERRIPNRDFFTSRGAYVKLHYIACYTLIRLDISHRMFKMRDSVPSTRYSSVCNVLHLWRILLIPTYRVYRL